MNTYTYTIHAWRDSRLTLHTDRGTHQVKYIQPLFIFWTLLLILVGRALNVYPLSWVVNRYALTELAQIDSKGPDLYMIHPC